jgi:hypothetical protein
MKSASPDRDRDTRGFAMSTTDDNDIPVPFGADADDWEPNTADGYSRSLEWLHLSDDGIDVHIDGRQQADGNFTREISAYGPDDEIKLTADAARRMAAMLTEAADSLDRLTYKPSRGVQN